jgi:hypothetical protein
MSRFLIEELDKKFKQLEAIEPEMGDDDLEEQNVTSNLDGGAGPPRTPHAFAKTEKDVDNDHIEVLGYKKIKNVKRNFLERWEREIEGVIGEMNYRQYRKNETGSPQLKINKAIKEINRKIYEVEHLVNQNIKLKTEMGVSSNTYWKKTRNNFSKISERLNRISLKIKQLGA